MALVSSSVQLHLRQPQMHGCRSSSSSSSLSSSSSSSIRSARNLGEVEEVEEDECERVHVAVGKEYKESKETLIWVLRNISKDKKVVLVHVHRPAQMIPMMGAKFPANQLKEEQVKGYRLLEMQKMNKTLDEYLALCSHAKIQAEKLVIQMDDIGKGLLELIAQHQITELVMGAAADRQYSKKMKAPKSKTAMSVQQHANRSCKMWFVCKGNLICTRDTVVDKSGQAGSPMSSPSFSKLHPFRSKSSPQNHSHTLDWLAQKRRSESVDLRELMAASPLKMSIDENSANSSATLHLLHKSAEGISPPNLELEHSAMDSEIHEKLQRALKEAEDFRHEAYEQSCRRRKAEIDAIVAAQEVKASENLHDKELKLRKDIAIESARERLELEKLKSHHDELMEELQKTNEKKVQMGFQIAASERIIKDFQEKLSAVKCLLSSLQKENEKLQQEREEAAREAEELQQKREEAASSTKEIMNLTEFTFSELERATNNFDNSMKIGEGGYGNVYKGFLRHTVVAIKMLNSQSMQGQAEFYQEVEILSRVRHPHLVTLIGTCPEAWALIYEYLPQGSLEDRLACKDNTPPLPWYVRTRITAEICFALIFLHSYKPHAVVHSDIKPANILLGSNYTSKLGDFGISRLLIQTDNTNTLFKQTHLKGTFVYMDPEFASSGELTPRSDVYSFGIIILRLLTGRPALGIIKEVREAMVANQLHEMLDVSAGDWPFVQAKQLAHLALRCCEIERKKRPDLATEAWKVFESLIKANSSMESQPGNSCIPSCFFCPIFQEMMRDPHIAADGFTYEGEALKGWLDSGHDTSPMTNLKLSHFDIIPNRALRSAIQEWLDKHK